MQQLGVTADGAIVVNRHNSHLHVEVEGIIEDALSRIHTGGKQFIETAIEFGHVIGESICVDTTPNDYIVYAQRPGRKGLSRFVINREPVPSTKVMVVLKKTDKPKVYMLITAFVGGKAEVEPWDSRATAASLEFWQRKALVWDGHIVEGSTTHDCQY